MKKLILTTIAIFALVGCGGGGSNPSNLQELLPLNAKNDVVYALSIKSNNKRTLIAWREHESPFKNCGNTKCTKSYLYIADKLNGKWDLPSQNNYLRKLERLSIATFLFSAGLDVAMVNDSYAAVLTDGINVNSAGNTTYSRILLTEYKNSEWKPGNYIDSYQQNTISILPKISMDKNFNASLIYAKYDTSNNTNKLFYGTYKNGNWSLPSQDISTNGKNIYLMPSIDVKNNEAFLVWSEKENSNNSAPYHIYGANYFYNSNPPGWYIVNSSNPLENSSLGIDSSSKLETKIDKDDNKIVVWGGFDSNGVYHLYHSCFFNNNWIASHNPIDSDTADTSSGIWYIDRFNIDANENGFGIATWAQYKNQTFSIYTTRYSIDNCTFVSSDSTSKFNLGTGNAIYPQVAVNSSGKAALIWREHYNGKDRLYLAKYYNDSWHKPQLSEYISGSQDVILSKVAINDNGLITIAWVEKVDDDHTNLYKKEISIN